MKHRSNGRMDVSTINNAYNSQRLKVLKSANHTDVVNVKIDSCAGVLKSGPHKAETLANRGQMANKTNLSLTSSQQLLSYIHRAYLTSQTSQSKVSGATNINLTIP